MTRAGAGRAETTTAAGGGRACGARRRRRLRPHVDEHCGLRGRRVGRARQAVVGEDEAHDEQRQRGPRDERDAGAQRSDQCAGRHPWTGHRHFGRRAKGLRSAIRACRGRTARWARGCDRARPRAGERDVSTIRHSQRFGSRVGTHVRYRSASRSRLSASATCARTYASPLSSTHLRTASDCRANASRRSVIAGRCSRPADEQARRDQPKRSGARVVVGDDARHVRPHAPQQYPADAADDDDGDEVQACRRPAAPRTSPSHRPAPAASAAAPSPSSVSDDERRPQPRAAQPPAQPSEPLAAGLCEFVHPPQSAYVPGTLAEEVPHLAR